MRSKKLNEFTLLPKIAKSVEPKIASFFCNHCHIFIAFLPFTIYEFSLEGICSLFSSCFLRQTKVFWISLVARLSSCDT